MLKLSIIVPIYNVEPYLRKCVDSLLSQDLPWDEYEIILVDDGSPDGCPAICDEYAQTLHSSRGSQKGANIRVLHQPNGGLSAARNSGLRMAQGKYVQFVDSDDYLEPNVLGGLVAQMEREELDVLRFDYQNVHITSDGTYEVFKPYKHPHQVDKRTDVVDGEKYLNERMGYACYAVMFMIRRKMLLTNQLAFVEGILYEDTEWTPRMLLSAKRVNGTTAIVYKYLLRIDSITNGNTLQKKIRNAENILMVNESLRRLLNEYSYSRWIKGCMTDNVMGVLIGMSKWDYANINHWLDYVKKSKIYPLCSYKQSRIMKIKIWIANIAPSLFCWLIHMKYAKLK